jgi:hypothetical protein
MLRTIIAVLGILWLCSRDRRVRLGEASGVSPNASAVAEGRAREDNR